MFVSAQVRVGGRKQEYSLGRCFIAGLRPHQVVIPSRAKAPKLARLLISLSSRTELQPNSRGENLNLRYNLAKRSVELLLCVRDEI